MKTLLLSVCISFSYWGQAQTTILPLLKNSARWQLTGWEMGGFFNQGTSHQLSYSTDKDTLINGKTYKSLIRRYSSKVLCHQTWCSTVQMGTSGTDTLFVRQVENTIVTSKNDTLFSLSGTAVGDSAKLSYRHSKLWPFLQPEYLKISNVRMVTFGLNTVRLFTFEHKDLEIRLFYLDGIGFSTGGPLPESGYYELAEKSSSVTCYQLGNSSYTTSWNPVTIVPSSGACNIILSYDDPELNSTMKIYVNESYELMHDVVAGQIEIMNSMGQPVLSNQNATKTDLSTLKSGVYVAILAFGTEAKSYRFLLR